MNQPSSSMPLRIAVLFATGVAGFFRLVDPDFWWHLKIGQLIAQTHVIPTQEMYSFTMPGASYVDHEWLFQILQYGLYTIGGPAGPIVFKCIVLVCMYGLLTGALLRADVPPAKAAFILVLSLCGARIRFLERPELFTFLFLVVEYILLDAALKKQRPWMLACIFPVIVLWSNFHAAVILGLILQICFLFGLMLQRLLIQNGFTQHYPEEARWKLLLAATLVTSILLTGCNPAGYSILKVPFELNALMNSGLIDNQEWMHPPFLKVPFYYACLLFTFGVMLLQLRKLHPANFLFAAFLGYISLKYVRNAGLFCVFMPLAVAPYLAGQATEKQAYRGWIVAAIALFILLIVRSPFQFGAGLDSRVPVKLTGFIKKNNLKGNPYHPYGLGGYLIWDLFPERKVFIDGRNEVYVPLFKEMNAASQDAARWQEFLRSKSVEYAVLNYRDQLYKASMLDKDNHSVAVDVPYSSIYFPRSLWATVYWDDNGMILVRRAGANSGLNLYEYKSVYPEGRLYEENLVLEGSVNRIDVALELKHKLQEDPGCQRAHRMLENIEDAAAQ